MADPTPARGISASAKEGPPLWVWAGAAVGAAAGLYHLGLLYYIFFGRLTYPLDVEWMEGGMLCHALRLMEGKPLYAPPSAEFISYLYTPLYSVVLAALGKVFGLSYALGRAVSVLAFTGCLALLFRAVQRQTGGGLAGALWGLCGAGLAASSFQHTYGWFDLVRNDSLYLLLVTAFLYLLIFHARRSWRALAAAGVLAGLSFLTKQTSSMFIIFSGAAFLIISWRRLPVYVGLVAMVAGGTCLIWNHTSDGWFWKYIYEMHQGHDFYWDRIWPVTEEKLLEFFPVVGGMLGLWLLAAPAAWIVRKKFDGPTFYWFMVALCGVGISAVGYATQWASFNAFIPGLLFPGAFAALAAGDLTRKVAGRGRAAGGRWWIRSGLGCLTGLLLGGALAGQLYWQRYEAAPHLPDERDRKTGVELLKRLADLKGEILMPYHPFYPTLVGKRPSYPQMGINDITRAGYPFPADILQRVEKRGYGAVILDNPPAGRYDFVFGQYKLGHYFPWKSVPRPITGYKVKPTYLFVPRGKEPPPPGSRRVFDFEQGNYKGWTVEGEAFSDRPASGPIWGQGPVGPYEGTYLANSYHGGDEALGRLISPPFKVDLPWLSYRIGGGNQRGALDMVLKVGGKVIHRDSGTNSDIMQQRRLDVRTHEGEEMVLELIDRSTGSWGHLLFDELRLERN